MKYILFIKALSLTTDFFKSTMMLIYTIFFMVINKNMQNNFSLQLFSIKELVWETERVNKVHYKNTNVFSKFHRKLFIVDIIYTIIFLFITLLSQYKVILFLSVPVCKSLPCKITIHLLIHTKFSILFSTGVTIVPIVFNCFLCLIFNFKLNCFK